MSLSKKGGRKAGVGNYRPELLLDCVEAYLPIGEVGWRRVAVRYQELSNEEMERSHDDIKRQFMENLANRGKVKPTGTAERLAINRRAISIYEKMLAEENGGIVGDSEDEEEDEQGLLAFSEHNDSGDFDAEMIRANGDVDKLGSWLNR